MGEMIMGYFKHEGEPVKRARVSVGDVGGWVLGCAKQLARPTQERLTEEERVNELMQADARRREGLSIDSRILKGQTIIEEFSDGNKVNWHAMREEGKKYPFVIDAAFRKGMYELGLNHEEASMALSLYMMDIQQQFDSNET